MEGDPDRPLVTGRVYNAVQTVPYALPANKTVATPKTRSTLDGAAANFNELRFENKKGGEYAVQFDRGLVRLTTSEKRRGKSKRLLFS